MAHNFCGGQNNWRMCSIPDGGDVEASQSIRQLALNGSGCFNTPERVSYSFGVAHLFVCTEVVWCQCNYHFNRPPPATVNYF